MKDLKSSKAQEKKRKNNISTGVYVLLVVLTIVINIVLMLELFYLTKFGALSQDMFLMINYGGLGLLLLIDLFLFFAIKDKKKVLVVIVSILLIISGVGSGVAGFAFSKLNSTVNKITSTEYSVSVSTSLVTYSKADGDPIVTIEDLADKKIGLTSGTDTASVGQDYLKEANIQYEEKEYTDYFSLLRGLVAGEVNCAILPSNYINLMNNDEQLATYAEDTDVLQTFTKDVTATGVSGADKNLTTDPFTVLVTGENEGLADTIILVSVNPVSMDITMTSIARDSYVPITCYGGGRSKINASHVVSEACIVDTVTQLTGIPIDYTVEFNFASVIEVVDAVGGVDVANDTPFYGQSWNVETDSLDVIPIPHDVNGGIVHMNGKETLGFVRERHAFPDGDFARQRHQQAVISDLISKVLSSKDPNTYLKILDAAGSNIKTNLTTEQMVHFIGYAMKKAERYYDSSNMAGMFNISSSRITGYNVMMWDSNLGMYLYTYWLYDGALKDAWNIVDNNINMSATPKDPVNVSWSAEKPYVKPLGIQEVYNESIQTTIGGPQDGTNNEGDPNEPQQQYVPKSSPTPLPSPEQGGTQVQPEVPPVVEPDPQKPNPEQGGGGEVPPPVPAPEQGGSGAGTDGGVTPEKP